MRVPVFDSRAFTVPMEDVPNAFLWRQKDWYRNSVQMLGQAHFSHKQLNAKKLGDIHEMLHEKGINWAELSPAEKNGTFLRRVVRLHTGQTNLGPATYFRTEFDKICEKANYTMIQEWIDTMPHQENESNDDSTALSATQG